MSVNNFSNFNMPSLNGLVDINADSVTTTDLQSNDIKTVSLAVNGVDIGAQVEENKQKLTAITYTETPIPTTSVSSKFVCESDVNMTNTLLDLKGEMIIKDRNDDTNKMKIFYDAPYIGTRFLNQKNNGYIYFSVLDGAGNMKNFQFNSSQVYNNIKFFQDEVINQNWNQGFYQGDANSNLGGIIIYVPSTNPWDGWQFKNKGIPSLLFYTNFSNCDSAGNETQTFRMNYNTIWSLVQHIFNNNITVAGTSNLSNTIITGTLNVSSTLAVSGASNLSTTTITGLTVSGTSNLSNTTVTGTINVSSALVVLGASSLKAIFGTSLFISGGSTFNSTIVADSISVMNATNLNGNLNAISTSNFIGTATFSGSAVFNNSINAQSGTFSGPAVFNNTFNAQSGTFAGDLTINGTTNLNAAYFSGIINALAVTNFYSNVYLYTTAKLYVNSGATGITQNELSYLSGVTSSIQTQLNNKLNLSGDTMTGALVVNNTITNNNITQTGTTASTNRIIQPRIYADVTGSPNILKYTQIRYNSGSSTDKAALQCIDDNGGLALNFCPNTGSGSYNPMVNTNDRLIIAVNGDGSPSTLDLSTYGASGKHGIKINHASSTDYTTQIWANSYNFKVNSITGISATVGTNSLVMNSTNTTISGPVTFPNAVTANGSTSLNGAVLLGTTTLLNNNILQYGSSIINQDMSGTYSGTNLLKITNITQNTSGTATPALLIKDSSSETQLFFLPNSGSGSYNSLSSLNYQSIIGGGSTADSANFVLSTWSTVKNGIKMSATSSTDAQTELWAGTSSNIILNNSTGVTVANTASITYTDSSIQTTAYTSAKDTKLNNIGSITTASLTATTTLTTATYFNCGSITLSAGTYMLTLNCCMSVITGATTVSQLLMAPSTSSTALSSSTNLSIINGGGISYGSETQWVLTTSAIVSPTASTTYYMLCQAGFGTASRMQFTNDNSGFQAVRIA